MDSHGTCSQGTKERYRGKELVAHLFDIDANHVESLSWSLGHRVTVEADAPRDFQLEHRRSPRSVTAFAVTDSTCVVRLQTPIGREKFYGVASIDLRPLPDGDDWIQTE